MCYLTFRPTLFSSSRLGERHYLSICPWTTNWLIPICIFFEKLVVSLLGKKFPASYGSRMFVVAFTKACCLFLRRDSSIQSTPFQNDFLNVRFNIIILSSFKSWKCSFFPLRFLLKRLNPPLFYPIPTTSSVHLVICDFFFGELFYPLVQPPSWRTTPFRLSATAYCISSPLPSML
jgi:hypothetical protein